VLKINRFNGIALFSYLTFVLDSLDKQLQCLNPWRSKNRLQAESIDQQAGGKVS
jgi:hypothetical protein